MGMVGWMRKPRVLVVMRCCSSSLVEDELGSGTGTDDGTVGKGNLPLGDFLYARVRIFRAL
jgi:hypothetical protein